jgi:V/A-type H+-transporting ATPase subunit A
LYELGQWFNRQVAGDWANQSQRARRLLQRESELQEIVQLVGSDALAEIEKGDLAAGRMLREDFLRQSGFSENGFCPPEKSYWMLKVILCFYDQMAQALKRGLPLEQVLDPDLLDRIGRMKEWPAAAAPDRARELLAQIEAAFSDGYSFETVTR